MNRKIILAGSGGHAKVLRNILEETNLIISYLVTKDRDDDIIEKYFSSSKIIEDKDILLLEKNKTEIVNGIGSLPYSISRSSFFRRFHQSGYKFKTIISKHAFVSKESIIEEGVQVFPGAVIQPGVTIGRNTIINTGALIDHDCLVGSNNHIAPGAVLSGNVRTDDNVHVGTNASIIQGIEIGQNSVISAGVCAVKDVPSNHTLFSAKSTLKKNK
jgi:sugar O-acyltransferase (sialic acid O-acetyltransferase NeuD family)